MEEFVTYEQAEKLAELGFDYKCIACYDEEKFEYTGEYSNYNSGYYRSNLISAPTLAQVHKWLREVKGVDITIDHDYHRLDTGDKVMYGLHIGNQATFKTVFYYNYDSYEQALESGITEALKFLKQ